MEAIFCGGDDWGGFWSFQEFRAFGRGLGSGKGCDAGLDGRKHIIGVLALLCEIALERSKQFIWFRFILEARIVV
jgi:hypothetical protein